MAEPALALPIEDRARAAVDRALAAFNAALREPPARRPVPNGEWSAGQVAAHLAAMREEVSGMYAGCDSGTARRWLLRLHDTLKAAAAEIRGEGGRT